MPELKEIGIRLGQAWHSLSALRYYAGTLRGPRKRDQETLAAFLKDVAERELADFTLSQVTEWVGTSSSRNSVGSYMRGDTEQYEMLLRAIHPRLLERTREYAYRIAFGSGRTPLTDEARARIEREFSADPLVIPPPPQDLDD